MTAAEALRQIERRRGAQCDEFGRIGGLGDGEGQANRARERERIRL